MTKLRRSFRFDEVDIAEWTEAAKKEGLSLSEWIRRRCNEGPAVVESPRREYASDD